MKKTQWIELFALIRKTLVSFLTVALLAAVSVSVYTGFGWSYRAVKASVNGHFETYGMHDFEITAAIPLGEDEVRLVRSIRGIERAEGVHYACEFFRRDGRRLQARFVSLTEGIDRPSAVEGTLPTGEDEVAVEKYWANQNGVQIGDVIALEDTDSAVGGRTFTVTALAESPAFISNDTASYGVSPATATPIDCVMFLAPPAFRDAPYSAVLATSGELRGLDTFGEEYRQKSAEIAAPFASLPGVAVFTRTSNAGVNVADNGTAMFDRLKLSMGILLGVISQFVCAVTLVRIVVHQAQEIGIRKALGFRNREIAAVFVLYSLASSLLGVFAGILIARFVMEPLFLSTAAIDILFETAIPFFSPAETGILFALYAAAGVLTAILSCLFLFRTPAWRLLHGTPKTETPPLSHFPLPRRTPLFTRTVLGNLLRERRRVIASVLSIAGCAMLCVSALGVKVLVENSFTRHYEKIQSYDTVVYFDPAVPGCREETDGVLRAAGYPHEEASSAIGLLETPDGKGVCCYLFVTDNETEGLLSFFTMDGEKQELGEKLFLSCAFAEEYGLAAGDSVTYTDASGVRHALTVDGIVEYYLQTPCLFVGTARYRELFGEDAVMSAYLVNSGKTGCRALDATFAAVPGYVVSYDLFTASKLSFDAMNRACTIVLSVFLVLSAVMAAFVVTNLFVSLVADKKRELTVLIVNGYSRVAAARYVGAEMGIISICGILLGNVFGQWFCSVTLDLLSGYSDHFLHGFCLPACVVGSLITVALTLASAAVALAGIRRFSLTGSGTET